MPKKPHGPGVMDAGGNPNQNRKIVQANVQDRAWTETGKKMAPATKKMVPIAKRMKPINRGKMMGTNADQRGAKKLTGFDYQPVKGGGGVWKNPNGVQVGRSATEDSTIFPQKSTGDMATPASLQNAIHIHLHGGKTDGGANYQKLAAMANKMKAKK